MPPFPLLRGGQRLPLAQRRAMTSFPSVDSNIMYIPGEQYIVYTSLSLSGEQYIVYSGG